MTYINYLVVRKSMDFDFFNNKFFWKIITDSVKKIYF